MDCTLILPIANRFWIPIDFVKSFQLGDLGVLAVHFKLRVSVQPYFIHETRHGD